MALSPKVKYCVLLSVVIVLVIVIVVPIILTSKPKPISYNAGGRDKLKNIEETLNKTTKKVNYLIEEATLAKSTDNEGSNSSASDRTKRSADMLDRILDNVKHLKASLRKLEEELNLFIDYIDRFKAELVRLDKILKEVGKNGYDINGDLYDEISEEDVILLEMYGKINGIQEIKETDIVAAKEFIDLLTKEINQVAFTIDENPPATVAPANETTQAPNTEPTANITDTTVVSSTTLTPDTTTADTTTTATEAAVDANAGIDKDESEVGTNSIATETSQSVQATTDVDSESQDANDGFEVASGGSDASINDATGEPNTKQDGFLIAGVNSDN